MTALLDRHDSPKNGDDTNVEVGIRIVGGIEWLLKGGNAFFLELTGGFGDIPEVQFLAGWNFLSQIWSSTPRLNRDRGDLLVVSSRARR